MQPTANCLVAYLYVGVCGVIVEGCEEVSGDEGLDAHHGVGLA